MNNSQRLGLIALAFSLVGLFVWIPLDVETGLIEKVRRSVVLGDSLAPAVAFGVIALGGLLTIADGFRQQKHTTEKTDFSIKTHVAYAAKLLLAFVVFTVVLRYSGPALAALWPDNDTPYRLLRDTVPWKYTGFVLASVFLITAISSWMNNRFSWRFVIVSLLISLLIIALYDWPFEDLLLPPNGDV